MPSHESAGMTPIPDASRDERQSARAIDREAVAVLQEQVRGLQEGVTALLAEVREMRSVLDQQKGGMKVMRGIAYIVGGLAGTGLIGWLLGLIKGHP